MTCPSQYPRFNNPDNVRWTVQITEFLFVNISTFPIHLRIKDFQLMLFPQGKWPYNTTGRIIFIFRILDRGLWYVDNLTVSLWSCSLTFCLYCVGVKTVDCRHTCKLSISWKICCKPEVPIPAVSISMLYCETPTWTFLRFLKFEMQT